jgi:glycosyltransferase involved in cell wall biosynthesis
MMQFNKNSLIETSPTIENYRSHTPHPNRKEGGLLVSGNFHIKHKPGKPLVSIVTIVINGEKTLERTIQSVLNQTYKNIEYIIIDGDSTDGTLGIVRRYDDKIAYWMSEPDRGIGDAFNKGIAASTGEIIGLLNADDWLSVDQIDRGVSVLNNSSADFVFGDLLFHDSFNTVKHKIHGDTDYVNIINSRMPDLCHPTVLVKRNVYEHIGLFDIHYRFAMDYEWLLRLHKKGGSGIYVKEIIGHMRIHGVSERSYLNTLKEVRDIAVRYGQSKWIANYLYILRAIKGSSRRRLEKTVPKGIYHFLRGIVNPRYSSRI